MRTSHNHLLTLTRPRAMRILFSVLALSLALAIIGYQPKRAKARPAFVGQSFTFLQAGFTQEIIGVASVPFLSGVAFAPDGDPMVAQDQPSGGPLHRFDLGSAMTVNGTQIHPDTVLPSDAGVDVTSHPNGSLYSNTINGITKLDANTGAVIGGPFGPTHAECFGITVDPQTGNLVYGGTHSELVFFVNAALTTSGAFSAVLAPAPNGTWDGMSFDPTGNFLFLANPRSQPGIQIIARNGAAVQYINNPAQPDGLAFHATSPKFLLSNNNDGTITRYDFPGDDYTQPPVLSTFASGGFRGDLARVGADGCFYLTQQGTRYDDGTMTQENSLVRICGGFAPSICPTITLAPNTLPVVTVGRPYNQTITANPAGTYTYAVTAGMLPSGITLSPVGLLSGTTTAAGPYNFTIEATNAAGCKGSQAYTLVVDPGLGPGQFPPAAAAVSDQKAGSVLIYNIYTSSPTALNSQNTRINITNIEPSSSASIHLFFVDGSSCSVADSFLCLTPNQTISFLASDVDPGTTGYIVAVAVDGVTGCPINFNFLLGDEHVKFSSGHTANLGAEAVAALAGGLPACDATALTAQLNFDGVSYNALPRVLALDNFPSELDGNSTLLVLNTIGGGGNLISSMAPAAGNDNVLGLLFDDLEQSFSFTFKVNCQLRQTLTGGFPRTTPPLRTVVANGHSGWLRVWKVNDVGMLGAAINFNAGAGANVFSQGHNLHKLTFAGIQSLTMPIIPPHC